MTDGKSWAPREAHQAARVRVRVAMVRTYGSETSGGGDAYGARQYDGYGDARGDRHRGQPSHRGGHSCIEGYETHQRQIAHPRSYGYGHHPAQPGRRERVDADGGVTGVCLGGYGGGTTVSPAPAKSFGVHRMRKSEVTGKVGGAGDVAAMQRAMGHDVNRPNAVPPPRRFSDRAIDAHASSSVYVPGGGFGGDGAGDRWGSRDVTGKVGSAAVADVNRVQPPRGFNDRAIDAHASSSVYVPGGGFGAGDELNHPQRRRQQQHGWISDEHQRRHERAARSEDEDEAPPFFPCDEFMGPRPGWCFKADRHGLGYYRDPVQERREPEVPHHRATRNADRDKPSPLYHAGEETEEPTYGHHHRGGRSATHHGGDGSQNRGNSIGTRPVVRQSKLFRRHESGNAMKDILGNGGAMKWDENRMQGGYSGATYDHEAHNDALLRQHEQASILREVLSEVRGGQR